MDELGPVGEVVRRLTYCPTCFNQTPNQEYFEWDSVEARLTLHCKCGTTFTVVYVIACVEDVEIP